jgi:myosin heavy subunit
MISSRSHLASILILTCICIPALCQDANNLETQLKFEVSQEERAWVRNSESRPGRGPIKPSYSAEFAVYESGPDIAMDLTMTSHNLDSILRTSAGQLLSREQQRFLAASDALAITDQGDVVRHHYILRLYAVSQKDAKKMTEALIQVLAEKSSTRFQQLKNRVEELEEKASEARRDLAQQETKQEHIATELQKAFKEGIHSLDAQLGLGSDAPNKAKETVLEMNRTLDVLEVEIAGIRAELSAVDEYKSKKNVSIEALVKLEQILCEQTVKLAGALARKKAAVKIRAREERFYNLYKQWEHAAEQIDKLRRSISSYEDWLGDAKRRLTDLTPNLLPKVYENKVTIYPVSVGE